MKNGKRYQTWSAVDEVLDQHVADNGLFKHEINYYLPSLTLREWADLDYAMTEAFFQVLGEERASEVIGMAGPIPFNEPLELPPSS